MKEVAVLRPFNSEGTCALRLFNQYSPKDVCKAGCLNHFGVLIGNADSWAWPVGDSDLLGLELEGGGLYFFNWCLVAIRCYVSFCCTAE